MRALGPKAAGLLCFSGATVTQLVGLRLLVSKSYVRSLRYLSASSAGPRSLPLAASEDDDQRFAKRRRFFENFVAQHGVQDARFKFIHVTGTKGKGTVCELVRCGLIANGKRVGTFTSPHLHSVRERIRINDRCIPQSDFARLWHRVQEAFRSGEEDTQSWAVFFDKVLALALAFFIEEKVEYVILEVGIGGRYDSTNFITEPAACVITSISMDHTDMLGDRLEMIAWQKAGIIKKGCLAITSTQQPREVLEILGREAEEQGASELLLVPPLQALDGQRRLGAEAVQAENEALARAVLERLGLNASGLERAYWPARFEVFEISPRLAVVVDAAHNTASVSKTLHEARARFPGRRLVCVFGTGSDKDQQGMLQAIMAAQPDRLLLVQASHGRAATVESLRAHVSDGQGGLATVVSVDTPRVPEALLVALGSCKPGPEEEEGTVVVAFGSFYVASAARVFLSERMPGLFRPDDWVFQGDDDDDHGAARTAPLLLSAMGLKHAWRRARAWWLRQVSGSNFGM